MTQRNILAKNEEGYDLRQISSNGKVKVTLNGEKSTYKGAKASVHDGQLYIDNIIVKKDDPRRLPDNSFSLFSESYIEQLKQDANRDGSELKIDDYGNMTWLEKK